MREELKEYLNKNAFHEMWYGASTESWMDIIDNFFDQYRSRESKIADKIKKEIDKLGEIGPHDFGRINGIICRTYEDEIVDEIIDSMK